MANNPSVDERCIVSIDQLARLTNASSLPFSDTIQLCDPEAQFHLIGQQRAQQALQTALTNRRPRYHAFVSGLSGCGRLALALWLGQQCAQTSEACFCQTLPQDLVAVASFANISCPQVKTLPAGTARDFCQRFDYQLGQLQQQLAGLDLPKSCRERTVQIDSLWNKTVGLVDCPNELVDYYNQASSYLRTRLANLDLQDLQHPMDGPVSRLLALTMPKVLVAADDYLNARQPKYAELGKYGQLQAKLHRPVLYLRDANERNLFGGICEKLVNGQPYLDHSCLEAGELFKANGGCLILWVQDLVANPTLFRRLKTALLNGWADLLETEGQRRVVFECLAPVNVKIVLIGTPLQYQSISESDAEFLRLFPVRADLDEDAPRDSALERDYGQFLADCACRQELLHCTAEAVAEFIDYSSWYAESQNKLSLRFGDLLPLMHQASYLASEQGRQICEKADVIRSRKAFLERATLVEERLAEMTKDGVIRIDTSGEAIGQVNGLTVIDTGDYEFGRPSRISARVAVGKDSLVDIERECENGGKLHSKGIMVLSGFLYGRFANEAALPVSITTCFEQNYDEIEGDSASSAEAIAILSALARVPVRQGIAITGSLDQFGNVQAIGGVNEKIAGFYKACLGRGLRGKQGVIIPKANLSNLQLNETIRQAVAKGRFSVWAVSHLDEALELLTGIPAGRARAGRWPKNSLNGMVVANMEAIVARARELAE